MYHQNLKDWKLEWVTVAQCGGWYHPVARWQPLVADGQTQKHKLQVIVLPKIEINIYVYISATQKEKNLNNFSRNLSRPERQNSEGNKCWSQESQRLLVPNNWSTLNNIHWRMKIIKWIQKIRMTSDDSWWIQCSTKQYRLLIQLHGKFKLKI